MKKLPITLSVIFTVIAVLLVCNGIYCNNIIETINYNIESDKLNTSLHFILVADLHNKEFGENNEKLVEKIKNENPDFIAVCGDLIKRGHADDSVMKIFLSQISQIAPTYCVLGNHELDMLSKLEIKSDINSTGAVLLDNEMIEFSKNGETVQIVGLTRYPNKNKYASDAEDFWQSFSEKSTENYSILLYHHPESMKKLIGDSNIDLVLCGHTHGGLIQIPFIGGVFAPGQGLFPQYDKGMFNLNGCTMIVTSGLSNSNPLPRINNCAEMSVIDIN